MPDTTTIVKGAEELPGAVVSGLAGAIGAIGNETKHQAEALAQHGEQLADGKENLEWLKTRLDNLEQAVATVPTSAIAELRADLAGLRTDFEQQMAAFSEALIPTTTDEPQTEPPPPQVNEAQPKEPTGPLGGLRKALHRLL